MSGINLDGKKILEALEKHADKIVLVTIAILCLFLLWKFVIGNPYVIKHSTAKYTPANIDKRVNGRAGQIEVTLDGPGKPNRYRDNMSAAFDNLMA